MQFSYDQHFIFQAFLFKITKQKNIHYHDFIPVSDFFLIKAFCSKKLTSFFTPYFSYLSKSTFTQFLVSLIFLIEVFLYAESLQPHHEFFFFLFFSDIKHTRLLAVRNLNSRDIFFVVLIIFLKDYSKKRYIKTSSSSKTIFML